MTRKSGRTGSTSTASSSSPRDTISISTSSTSPKGTKKAAAAGGILLNGDCTPTTGKAKTMTKAPRVNGVAERTSPIKTHHNHHQNGSAENLLLENGYHDASASNNSSSGNSPKGSKRASTGTKEEERENMSSPRLVVLSNGGDQSLTITGNTHQKLGTSYLSPTKSPTVSHNSSGSNTPLYKVIDKSMSYTKSPQLLSPGGTTRLQSQSPTTNTLTSTQSASAGGDGMRSPVITKSPAEEVKSNRRGQGQPSPIPSPLKSVISPMKSSSRPNTPAGVGRGGKKRTLRKNELSLLADEAENFMFPKAMEEVDSDSSDVIIIVKGKKKTKAKAQATGAGNVDDKTMALIKSEMGDGDDTQEEQEDVEAVAKAVNLLPLKKRFSTAKAKDNKATPSAGKKKGAKRAVKVKEEPVAVVEAEEDVPVAELATKSKKKGAKARVKKGAVPVVVKEEVVDEEPEPMEVEEAKVKPTQKAKRVKKETAKERRKREKLEKELSRLIKAEPEEEPEEEAVAEEETYSNLKRIIESEEVTRFRFAFERVPSMEPWFSAFHRQDEGEERIFEYYGSTRYKKLPYEMGELPPLPQNCCALSHLRGTPTKSPRKGRAQAGGEFAAKPTRLFTSARISMKRGKEEHQSSGTNAGSVKPCRGKSLPLTQTTCEVLPRKRGRPSLAARRLQEETGGSTREQSVESSDGACSGGEMLSAKQKATMTKNIVERKKKLLAELEHPRKSPREHASTLAILSCLLQQRQLNEKAAKKGENNVSEEESSDKNSEAAFEGRHSHCFEGDDKKEVDVDEEEMKKGVGTDEEDGSSEAMAATTTDGDTTETENNVGIGGHTRSRSRAALVNPEDIPLPMTPPPVPGSRTNTPALKRSNSAMSNQSHSGKKKKRKHSHWRSQADSINPQELSREIETLLTDPLNASAESIDCKVLDKSDEFLVPFHECPDFQELLLSVDEEDYKQGYVRKSFKKTTSSLKVAKNNILQLDYQLRSTKKRKNRTGWPTNKRRTSAAANQVKKEGNSKRSVSFDDATKQKVAVEEDEDAEEEDEFLDADAEGDIEMEDKAEQEGLKQELTIVTDEVTEESAKASDLLQKSPILRKLLSPQWKKAPVTESKELMPSPGGRRGTSSSPNGLKRAKGDRTPVSDLLNDGDESQSVSSSVSVIVSDDPDGQMLSSDNNTNPPAQSPSGLRLFKQTTLSRFFSRKKVTPPVASPVASAAGDEKEKENIENSQAEAGEQEQGEEEEEEEAGNEVEILNGEVDTGGEDNGDEEREEEEEGMEVDAQGEEDEAEEDEVEETRPVAKAQSRRKGESKLKNGINMNPIISIKKLPLGKVGGVAGGGGGKVAAVKKKKPRSSGQVGIRSKRQRRRKMV